MCRCRHTGVGTCRPRRKYLAAGSAPLFLEHVARVPTLRQLLQVFRKIRYLRQRERLPLQTEIRVLSSGWTAPRRPSLCLDPRWNSLRKDPRFATLVVRINIQLWRAFRLAPALVGFTVIDQVHAAHAVRQSRLARTKRPFAKVRFGRVPSVTPIPRRLQGVVRAR